ncbi:MAG: aminoacyl-tRNA hydrolase [Actinomycetota bacterium]|nr:aminoacyl-tRNA hydrolase [Actinomycetota bacterium]
MSWFRRGRDRDPDDPGRWVVVGLGNPGERYASTRHNLGAMTVDLLLERANARLKSHKSGCLIAEVSLAGERVVLARPTTYMNDSGRPVGQLVRFFHTPIDRVVVAHDELDIPFGDVRVKTGGGTAGHNGLRSIVNHLGSPEFARVRMGIGRPRGDQDAVKKVLDSFSSAERKELPNVLATAADAVETIVSSGIERAMNVFNAKQR